MPKNKRGIRSNLRKVDRTRVTAAEMREAPALTEVQLSRARIEKGGRPVGRPPLPFAKVAVKLRLDPDVVKSYRKTGDGWQTRMNADLRRARKLPANVSADKHTG